jgi:hypothetical protein
VNITRGQFERLLVEHSENTGFVVPELLLHYLVNLLDSRLTRTELIPDPSFAERYLMLYHSSDVSQYIDYADSALFFCSLMPEYGVRRGLSMEYYATLGISTYYAAGDLIEDDRYIQLGNWFYHLQKFLCTAIKPEIRLELLKI